MELNAAVFRQRFGVLEDVRVEEGLIGVRGGAERRGAFGVQLQGGLVQLEGLLDLDFLGVVDFLVGLDVGFDVKRFELRLRRVSG